MPPIGGDVASEAETSVWTGIFVLTKTQVTSSPSLTSIAFGGLWSLHELEVDVQSGVAVWVTEYTPGSSCPAVRWSPSSIAEPTNTTRSRSRRE